MNEEVLENINIERIASCFIDSPHRLNKIHEADAELIDLDSGSPNYLAITTDAVVEEIASGLYDDPYLIGWMLAMVNFSDLAAVGASPLGLLISVTTSAGQSNSFIQKLAEGISDACQRLNTHVLGGDTNQGKDLFLSACAIGLVPKSSVITRMGAIPGDKCYLSAPAGIGSTYALLKLQDENTQLPKSFYQPIARIKEGMIVRKFANCCMDTSDGVIHTLDTLMRLNNCQFVLYDNWEEVLHPAVQEICKTNNMPPWIILAGVHGEFELCFTVNPGVEKEFLKEAEKNSWKPILIGEVREGTGVNIRSDNNLISIETGVIRNLSETASSSPQEYINKLLDIARVVGI